MALNDKLAIIIGVALCLFGIVDVALSHLNPINAELMAHVAPNAARRRSRHEAPPDHPALPAAGGGGVVSATASQTHSLLPLGLDDRPHLGDDPAD